MWALIMWFDYNNIHKCAHAHTKCMHSEFKRANHWQSLINSTSSKLVNRSLCETVPGNCQQVTLQYVRVSWGLSAVSRLGRAIPPPPNRARCSTSVYGDQAAYVSPLYSSGDEGLASTVLPVEVAHSMSLSIFLQSETSISAVSPAADSHTCQH